MVKRAAGGDGEHASKRAIIDDSELSVKVLRHQNRQLGAIVQGLKRELATSQERIGQLEKERDLFDATASVIDRAWKLLDADLLSLGQSIGLTTRDFGEIEVPRIESQFNGTLPSTSRIIHTLAEASDCFTLADATATAESQQGSNEATNTMEVVPETSHLDLDQTLQKRVAWTTHLLAQLLQQMGKGEVEESSAKLHAQVRSLEAKVQLFSSKLSVSRIRIKELEAALDDAKLEVWRLSRRAETAPTSGKAEATQQTSEAGAAVVPASRQTSTSSAEEQPSRNQTPAIFGSAGSESSDLRSKIEEVNAIAASRLEELERLREQLKDALSQPRLHDAAQQQHSEELESLEKERKLRRKFESQAQRAQSTSLLALAKLKEAEARLADLEAASASIISISESALAQENEQLKKSIEDLQSRLAERTAEIESLRSVAVIKAEMETTMGALREERDSFKRRLEQQVKPGEESDALIAEIEQLSSALNEARDSASRLQQSLEERDRRVSELANEKAAMEMEIRELREEKNAFVIKTDKLQAVLKENEAFVNRLEERLTAERIIAQKAEDMARSTLEACEKAELERENARREAELERERAKAVDALDEELKQARLKVEESRWELSRSEEEVKTLKRRLERAKAALEAAAQQSSTGGGDRGAGSMRSIDEERLEAMTTALKCPIYKHLWKDCVISKCAHMFSRKALEDNLAARNRKCPSCKNTYSKDDLISVYLYQSNDV